MQQDLPLSRAWYKHGDQPGRLIDPHSAGCDAAKVQNQARVNMASHHASLIFVHCSLLEQLVASEAVTKRKTAHVPAMLSPGAKHILAINSYGFIAYVRVTHRLFEVSRHAHAQLQMLSRNTKCCGNTIPVGVAGCGV